MPGCTMGRTDRSGRSSCPTDDPDAPTRTSQREPRARAARPRGGRVAPGCLRVRVAAPVRGRGAARVGASSRAARRSSSPATTARRATSPLDLRAFLGPRRCASTRRAASATSRTSRRRPTSSACGSPRSTAARTDRARRGPPSSSQAPSRSWSGCPTRSCARTASRSAVGEELDLDETLERLVDVRLRARGAGLRARPVRRPRRHPRRLSGDRGAGGAGRAVRRRGRVAALVLDLHPALAGRGREVEIAPAAELDAEYRELAELAASEERDERPDVAEILPGRPLPLVPRAGAGARRPWWSPPTRSFGRRSPTTGTTSRRACTRPTPTISTCRPRRSSEALERRVAVTLLDDLPGPAAPVPRAGRRQRRALDPRGRARAREARPRRLRDRRRLEPPRRGRARRLQPGPPAPRVRGRRRRRTRRGRALVRGRARCARASSRRS